jgi:hypothetical protein
MEVTEPNLVITELQRSTREEYDSALTSWLKEPSKNILFTLASRGGGLNALGLNAYTVKRITEDALLFPTSVDKVSFLANSGLSEVDVREGIKRGFGTGQIVMRNDIKEKLGNDPNYSNHRSTRKVE